MTPIVSLYTVIASMIGALALVSLVVRQLLKGRAALGWLSLALVGGFGTTLLYSSGGTSPLVMAALAVADTFSIACACFAARAAINRPAVPRGLAIAVAALLGLTLLMILSGVGFPFLAAVPFQLGIGALLASTVAATGRSLRGLAETSILAGLTLNLVTYAIRLPFWPSLMDSGQGYHSIASGWLNLFMLVSSTLFVPLVVLGIIGREIGWLVGDYRDRSERDGMTGLANRVSFQARFDRHKAASGVLVLADIDRFKAINDRYGHHVGDKVILAFARIIGDARGLAARIGGEEFALAMPGATIEQARGDVEALRRAFHDLRLPDIDADHFLSASFGLAPYARGDGFGRVFAVADAALYQAKTRGRNQSVVGDADSAADPPALARSAG